MGQRGYKRRQIIVDKRMQFGLSGTVIVVLSCYLLLFCLLAVFSPFTVLLGGNSSEDELIAASNEISSFVQNLLWPIALTFTCLGLHCVLLSHRIAGPAYRFRRTFDAVRERDLSIDIHLRNGDYLHETADSYNAMMGDLRQDLAGIRDEVGNLTAATRELNDHTAGPTAERVAKLLSRTEALADRLGEYRLGDEPADPDDGEAEASEKAVEETVET